MDFHIPWDSLIAMAIAIFSSTGFWTWIIQRNGKKRKREEEDHEALEMLKASSLATLHDRLYYLCTEYIEKEHVSATEYENLNTLYTSYRNLGGNGTIKKLMEQINKQDITGN